MSDRERPARPERLRQAVELHRSGRLPQAEEIYRAILARKPDQPDAIHFLGVLQHQTGRSDEAIASIRRAIALRPDHPDMHNNLGNVLKDVGRADEAVTAYRRALELNPAVAYTYDNLGSALKQSGKLHEAVAAFDGAIARDPDRVASHYNRGETLRDLGRFEEALSAYEQVVRLKHDHEAAHTRLGQLLYRLGRIDEASAAYRRWLAQDPQNPIALHMLAASSSAAPPARCSDHFVETVFDSCADVFDEDLRGLQYRGPELIADALLAHLGPPRRALEVLDAGCGTGLCAPLLRPYAVRLTGVDLSARMLERAGGPGLYDELVKAELTALLSERPTAYDLVVAGDTLVYFGELRPVISAAAAALLPGGALVFTLERSNESPASGFALQPHGRYSHARSYVERILASAGLELGSIEAVMLREEAGQPVRGWLVVGRLRP